MDQNNTTPANETKLISTITEFIPTFFAPNGILAENLHAKGNESLNLNELLCQCDKFIIDHPNSFTNDISKISYVTINLKGLAKKWGLSLKSDDILDDLSYEEFKRLLIENFGDSKEQRYSLIERLLNLKQRKLGNAAEYTIQFRHLATRIKWPDSVLIDLLRRGLIEEVREEYDKKDLPTKLFEATNLIIKIDKYCYFRNNILNNGINEKTNKRRINIVGKHQDIKRNRNNNYKRKEEVTLSTSYTNSKSDQKMVSTFYIQGKNKKIPLRLLIDSGSSRSLMCKQFVSSQKLRTFELPSPIEIRLPNNKTMKITHTTGQLDLFIFDHKERFQFSVANLQLTGISAILGRDWLSIHKPYINFSNNHIFFLEGNCLDHCPSCKGTKIQSTKNVTAAIVTEDLMSEDTAKPDLKDLFEDEICYIMMSKELKSKLNNSKSKEIILRYYSNLLDVFETKNADTLPPHRPYDITINIIPGGQLYFGPIYSLTRKEKEELEKYIHENLTKGFIVKSNSPAGAPVMFVKKKDGSLRLCVDYRRLNSITIRNSFPIPRINDLIEVFKGAQIFSRLDLKSAYNLVRVSKDSEYLTAFRTPLGHFQYRVMPFGLRNAPSVFQRFIQDTLSEELNKFVQIYLDDIIIYSSDENQHINHVKVVLSKLLNNGLYCKIEKCEFHVKQTIFLGFVVSANGLLMDKDKIKCIMEWPVPKNLTELQSFLGFTNFYRRFIKDYAKIMDPLRKLLSKNNTFLWDKDAQNAFDSLKKSFNSTDILIFPDQDKEFFLETDASEFALGCVLSQNSSIDNLIHPIAFYSRSLTSPETNYAIYDKELLAIITAFDVWRHHLEGAKFPIKVFTDHRNLLFFKKPQKLSPRQIRWSLFLSKFDFVLSYRPGVQGGKPDALSRRPDYLTKNINESQILLKENNFCLSMEDNLVKLQEMQSQDPYCSNILNKFKDKTKNFKSSLFQLKNNILHFNNKIIVPSNLRITLLRKMHDDPLGGHLGIEKTLERISRNYWWPLMKNDISNYVLSCKTCGSCKVRRHKPYGLIIPLPVPTKPWEIIGVDFIVQLPRSQDCTCIMVVSDHLTKMIHLVATSDVPSSELTAKLLLFNVFKYHGFPKVIVSDHGSQFSAEFWTALCSYINAKPNLATAHHQQSNGQVERANAVIEQYLRCYCSLTQHDWFFYLPFCEITYNDSIHKSIGKTPFVANYGFNPSFQIDTPPSLLKDNASELVRNWTEHFNALKKQLIKAKQDFKKYGDNKKQQGPKLTINDKVWLRRYYFTNEPSRKLSVQYLGPFEIIEDKGRNNFKLKLPENSQLHPIFHISQLEPYTERNKNLNNSESNVGETM